MKVDSRSVKIILINSKVFLFSNYISYLISSVPESGQRYVRIPIYDHCLVDL